MCLRNLVYRLSIAVEGGKYLNQKPAPSSNIPRATISSGFRHLFNHPACIDDKPTTDGV